MTLEEATERLRKPWFNGRSNIVTGGLHNLGWYLNYNDGEDMATLDGQFAPDDLEAIAIYMRSTTP